MQPAAGVAEIERVLRPAGAAAWVWNLLDVRVRWVATLARIWHTLTREEGIDTAPHLPALTSAFTPVESTVADWVDPMEVADLAALVTTRSYYLHAAPAAQREIRDRSAAFLRAKFPDAERVNLPYRTHCFRAFLRAA